MRLACWQAEALEEPADGYVRRLAAVAERAREAGADLLVTPELSLTGYRTTLPGVDHAASWAENAAASAASIAASAGIAIVYGCPERSPEGIYNSVQLVDAHGEVLAVHRKSHLFGDAEGAAFRQGDGSLVQARIGDVTVGLLICYEVEFPELVRAHALRGTQLLAVPGALARPWTVVTRTLVPARAFESQLYVTYVNWSGVDGRTHYSGLTRVVNPHGRVQTAPGHGEALLVADIDPAEVVSARRQTPYLIDRRPALYRDLVTER